MHTDLQSVSFVFRLLASLFFVGLTLTFQGLAVFMAYEVVALYTRVVPTISLVTSFEFLKHQNPWVVIFGLVMFALGALTAHFTLWTP